MTMKDSVGRVVPGRKGDAERFRFLATEAAEVHITFAGDDSADAVESLCVEVSGRSVCQDVDAGLNILLPPRPSRDAARAPLRDRQAPRHQGWHPMTLNPQQVGETVENPGAFGIGWAEAANGYARTMNDPDTPQARSYVAGQAAFAALRASEERQRETDARVEWVRDAAAPFLAALAYMEGERLIDHPDGELPGTVAFCPSVLAWHPTVRHARRLREALSTTQDSGGGAEDGRGAERVQTENALRMHRHMAEYLKLHHPEAYDAALWDFAQQEVASTPPPAVNAAHDRAVESEGEEVRR